MTENNGENTNVVTRVCETAGEVDNGARNTRGQLYEPFMSALLEEKRMPVYYVNIACYITKDRSERGFSANAIIPVRVEAESIEAAKQRVGEVLSEAIAAKDAIAKAIKELEDAHTADQEKCAAGTPPQGESDVS